MKKGNTEFAKLIDDALIASRKSGKMYELQKKWFGTSFKDMPAKRELIPASGTSVS